jgi:DNA-binding MarR family transcriptional regulator
MTDSSANDTAPAIIEPAAAPSGARPLPWPADYKPSDSFGYRLWHVSHAWQRRMEAALAPLDLTQLQFVTLAKTAWISRTGEIPSQTRVACEAAMDRMMISKVIRLLECKGYITRAPHPDDPRANRIDLTDAGYAALTQAMEIVLAEQADFFGRLGEAGKNALAEQLDRLLRAEGINS